MDTKDKKYRGTQCQNCDTHLDISEKYCHVCGQLNSTKKLTLRDFIDEFFANFASFLIAIVVMYTVNPIFALALFSWCVLFFMISVIFRCTAARSASVISALPIPAWLVTTKMRPNETDNCCMASPRPGTGIHSAGVFM